MTEIRIKERRDVNIARNDFRCLYTYTMSVKKIKSDPIAKNLEVIARPKNTADSIRYLSSFPSVQYTNAKNAKISKKVLAKSTYALIDSHPNTKLLAKIRGASIAILVEKNFRANMYKAIKDSIPNPKCISLGNISDPRESPTTYSIPVSFGMSEQYKRPPAMCTT